MLHALKHARSYRDLLVPALTAILIPAPGSTAQTPQSPFQTPVAVLPLDSSPFQKLFDFDGDGDLDAVGSRTNGNNNEVVVWRNDQGTFAQAFLANWPGGSFTGLPRSLAIATGDFDGNGRADFIASLGVTTTEFLSQPDGSFAITNLPMTLFAPRRHAAAAGDFDGDGRDDFAVAAPYLGTTYRLDLHLSTQAQTATTFVASALTSPVTPRLTAANLTGNGALDLLFTEESAAAITAQIVRYAGGQFQVAQTLTTSVPIGSTFPLWTAGDIDGDGDTDVVVFRKASFSLAANYQIFRRTGPATFTAEPIGVGGPAEYLADVDQDGDLDGVCCSGGGGSGGWPQLDFGSVFEVSLNTGSGFAPAFEFAGAGSESLAGAADIDGDGDVDLVAGRCIKYAVGPLVEPPARPVAAGPNSVLQLIGLTQSATADRFYDHDCDGDPDLYTRNGDLINRGDGVLTFLPANSQLPAPPPGKSYYVPCYMDLDNDGLRDVVAVTLLNGAFSEFSFLRNNGAGHYDLVGPASVPGTTWNSNHLTHNVADLDGDGDDDLIMTSNGANDPEQLSSAIYWNQGGTLVRGAHAWLAGVRVSGAADFDGDGLPDLVIQANVLRGTGDPANPFVNAVAIPLIEREPLAFRIADLNDDGRPDMIYATTGGGLHSMMLLTNTTPPGGPMSFVSLPLNVLLASISGVPQSTATTGDFDGNGMTDIAIGGLWHEPGVGVLMLRRSGTGNALTLADYAIARQMIGGFACDYDGDGDLDLLSTVATPNMRFHGVAAGWRIQDGVGSIGEGGSTPRLSAIGPFRSGNVERVTLRGLPGPSWALFGYSGTSANLVDFPVPGTTLRIDPGSSEVLLLGISGSGLGRGAASVELPFLIPPTLFGLTFYAQAFVLDSSVPTGLTCSNLMVQTMGS